METVVSRAISTDQRNLDNENDRKEVRVGQESCPDCNNTLYQGSGCAVCMCCGYSPCG